MDPRRRTQGSILSLAIGPARCLRSPRGARRAAAASNRRPERRALGGGSWTAVEKVTIGSVIDPDDLIATQAGVAAIINGRDVLVTGDGGLTFTANPIPCPPPAQGPSVAVTSPHGLALLCIGEGYTGHTMKRVYVSRDDGAHWARPGAEPGRRWRHHRGHRRRRAWPSPPRARRAGCSIRRRRVDLADHDTRSTTAGWLGRPRLHHRDRRRGGARTANSDGNSTQRPGQLFLTSDGGTTWYQVSF